MLTGRRASPGSPLCYHNPCPFDGLPDTDASRGLRLDLKEAVFGEYEKGKIAVVPGKLESSELWKRISTSDKSDLMPPPKHGKSLTKAQIDILRRWIEEGAGWQGQWD
jgi:hypothetical protein